MKDRAKTTDCGLCFTIEDRAKTTDCGLQRGMGSWSAYQRGHSHAVPGGFFYSTCARKFSASRTDASLLERSRFAELTDGWRCRDGLGSDEEEGDVTCCLWDVRLSGPAASCNVYGLSVAFSIFSKVFPPRVTWKQNNFICEGNTPVPLCSLSSVASMEEESLQLPETRDFLLHRWGCLFL